MKYNNHHPYNPHNEIPDIDIIDLEDEYQAPSDGFSPKEDFFREEPAEDSREDWEKADWADSPAEDAAAPIKRRFRINMHLVLLFTFLLFIFALLYKFFNWGERVDLSEFFQDGPVVYEDTLDSILPLMDEEGHILATGKAENIVLFGNAPFADDRDSSDGLAAMIADKTGAAVYNCAVSGSYLAAESPKIDSENHPVDAFNFYWLCTLATGGDIHYFYDEVRKAMGGQLPAEGEEVYQTLTTLDFSTVDTIAIMYDASDYLAGHEMYSDQNSTDIQQFTGNMEAGIELLQAAYPHIRIIVMSPAYAYAIDEETGEYVSSDMYRYGQDVLSTYVIKQYASAAVRSVSFVDNLYGTITEDNARKYLTDNLHLNVEGRKKVAERFVYALNYYNNTDTEE